MKKFLITIITALSTFCAFAQTADISLEDNLKTPVVPEKNKAQVQAYMRKEAENLVKAGYRVETMRKGQIVIVTIPTDPLFPPNDSTLNIVAANKLLKPLAAYLRVKGRYKVLMAVHTDDTGSPAYTERLAESRVHAVYDYLDKIAGDNYDITAYPVGQAMPETPNTSRAAREKNRRIEFYIVPDKELIQTLAKRSR